MGAASEIRNGYFFGGESHGCAQIGAHSAFPVGSDEGETAAIGHFADFEARGIAAELRKAFAVEVTLCAVASLA